MLYLLHCAETAIPIQLHVQVVLYEQTSEYVNLPTILIIKQNNLIEQLA